MNMLAPFNFGDQPIRIEDRDGAPWFVLVDVCRVLGISNPSVAARRLDADERDDLNITDPIGRAQTATVVNESGLYRLILTSRKDSAKRFGKWVTSEVLPSIRRTGGYGAPAAPLDLTDTATLHRLLLSHTGKALAQEERIAALEPRAAALDLLTRADGALAPTHVAKAIGVPPGKLFDWLEANAWMYRGANGLVAYQDKIKAGLLVHKVERIDRGPDKQAKIVNRALITPKGMARLAEIGVGR
ncbi:BRO family protein [Sphingomonas sp.]